MPNTNSFIEFASRTVSIGGRSFLLGRGVSNVPKKSSSVPFKEILGTFEDTVSPRSISYSTTGYLLKFLQPSKDVGFQHTAIYTIYMGFPKLEKSHFAYCYIWGIITYIVLCQQWPYRNVQICIWEHPRDIFELKPAIKLKCLTYSNNVCHEEVDLR